MRTVDKIAFVSGAVCGLYFARWLGRKLLKI